MTLSGAESGVVVVVVVFVCLFFVEKIHEVAIGDRELVNRL
jgi:hypothetical protein